LQPGQFLNLIACLEAMGDQHELLARLRDKQPLVVVSQMAPILVPAGSASAAPVAASAVQVVAGASAVAVPVVTTASAVEEEAETDASQEGEVEAASADQPSFMPGLSFMGASLFD